MTIKSNSQETQKQQELKQSVIEIFMQKINNLSEETIKKYQSIFSLIENGNITSKTFNSILHLMETNENQEIRDVASKIKDDINRLMVEFKKQAK